MPSGFRAGDKLMLGDGEKPMMDPTVDDGGQVRADWGFADGVRRALRVATGLESWEIDRLVEAWINQPERIASEQIEAWAQVSVINPAAAVGLDARGVYPEEVRAYGLADQVAQGGVAEVAELIVRLRGPVGVRQLRQERSELEGFERARVERDTSLRRDLANGTLRIRSWLTAWQVSEITDELVDNLAGELADMDLLRASSLIQLNEMDQETVASIGQRRPNRTEVLAAELFYEQLPIPGDMPDALEMCRIAAASIRVYNEALPTTRFGADTITASSMAIERTIEAIGDQGASHEIRAIGTAAIGLYSSYLNDPDRLPPSLAWEETLKGLLDAWSPPAQNRPADQHPEPINILIGTPQERAELAAALVEVTVADDDRWVQQLHPLVRQRSEQQAMLTPTLRLREQLSTAMRQLANRPQDRSADLDRAARQLARRRHEHRQMVTALASTPIDEPIGHQHAKRLRTLAEQLSEAKQAVARISVQQDARTAWDQAHLHILARADLAAAELVERERLAIGRLAANRPAYLQATLGPLPSGSARQRWLDAARTIERYRIDNGVTDPADPFGPPSPDPEAEAARQAAIHAAAELRAAPGQVIDGPPLDSQQGPRGPEPPDLL